MTTKTTAKLIGISVLFSFLAACSSNDSGGGGGGGPSGPQATPTPSPGPGDGGDGGGGITDPTPDPRPTGTPGTFIKDKDLNETQVAQTYDDGCVKKYEPTSKKGIDPRLHLFDEFSEKTTLGDELLIRSFTLDYKLTGYTPGQIAEYNGAVGKVSNIPELAPGTAWTRRCEMTAPGEGECKGNGGFSVNDMHMYQIVSLGGGAQTAYQKGWFVLADGIGRPAIISVSQKAGAVVGLNPPNVPKLFPPTMGTETKVTIRVLSVPDTGLERCGGTIVYDETTTKSDDNQYLSTFQFQLLGTSADH